MKTTVAVEVVARKTVYIDVDHETGDDPCDLTPGDEREAFACFELGQGPRLEVEHVEEVRRAADEGER